MQVTVQAAESSLPELIDAVLAGEEVVITRGDKPVVRLVPLPQGRFSLGILKGQLAGPAPDFFQPLEEEELVRWEGGR